MIFLYDTYNEIFLTALIIIALISFLFYRSDSKLSTYDGKTNKVPSVMFSALIIKVSFYGTFIITTVAIMFPSQGLLILWQSDVAKLIGSLIGLLGIAVFVSGKLTLGKNYTPCFRSFLPKSITSHGIYASIRHPIYSGNMLIFIGALIGSGSLWMLPIVVAISIVYVRSVKIEEKYLLASFPDYGAYMESSGRFFPRFFRPNNSFLASSNKDGINKRAR